MIVAVSAVRRRRLGGILDDAAVLVRDQFGVFLKLTVVLLLPAAVAIQLLNVSVQTKLQQASAVGNVQVLEGALRDTLLVLLPLAGILQLIVLPLASGALMHAAAAAYLNRQPTFGRSLRHAFKLFLPLLLVNLLWSLGLFFGSLLCLVPGIIFYCMFYLALPALVIEGVGPLAAFERSAALTRNDWVLVFALAVILFVVNLFMGMSAALIPEPYLQSVSTAVISSLLEVFKSAVGVVLYFSSRCRVENFDLVLLAQQVAANPEEPEPPSGLSAEITVVEA